MRLRAFGERCRRAAMGKAPRGRVGLLYSSLSRRGGNPSLRLPERRTGGTVIAGDGDDDVEYHRDVVTARAELRPLSPGLLQIRRGDAHRWLVALGQFRRELRCLRHE